MTFETFTEASQAAAEAAEKKFLERKGSKGKGAEKDKIEKLKKEIKDLKSSKEPSVKIKDKRFSAVNESSPDNSVEKSISEKEEQIRSLEKEIKKRPIKDEIEKLKKEIKDLEGSKEPSVKIVDKRFSADVKSDSGSSIESQILKKEEKIRALEKQIIALDGSAKKEKTTEQQKVPAEVQEKKTEKSAMQEDMEDINDIYKGLDNETAKNPEQPKSAQQEEIDEVNDAYKKVEDDDELARQKAYRKSLPEEIDDVNKAYEGIEKKEATPNKTEEKENTQNTEKDAAEREARRKERAEKIENLKKEIVDARKEYLVVDYNKNTALRRLRKFFGNIAKDKREEGLEEDQEIALLRANYDNKLFDLQKLQMEEARENGASNEELANLFAEFRIEQNITLAAEHDMVKIEQQEGSMQGFVGKKLTEVSKWYQGLPFKTKIAVAGVFVGAGFLAGGVLAGTAAAGAIGNLMIARRLFGGVTAGVGISLGLEAQGQKKDQEKIEAEKQAFLRRLENLSEEEKYQLLSNNIENIAIKDEENSINRIKNQDIKQLAAGAAVGTFIGSGMMADLVKWGLGGIKDYIGWGVPEKVPTGAPIEIDHHEPVFDQNLTIEKGSSIEGTIIKQLKEMGVENPGAKAHRMFLEYMDQNQDSIIEKVGADEYHKMLQDGMVNVQPGTELHVVADTGENGFSLREVHGSMSHIEPKVGHIDIPDETHSDIPAGSATGEIRPEVGNSGAGVLEYENGGDVQSSSNAMGNEMETGAGQENLESAANNEEYQNRVNVAEDIDADNKVVENATDHKMSAEEFNVKHGNIENYRGLSNFVRAEDADSVTLNKTIASENAKSLARAVFGYNIDTGQVAYQLKGEKIMGIMDARGREEFLQKLPSENSRRVFKEMLKAAPPKLSHDNMLKWFQYVAMGAGRAKNLQTFDTTGF